MTFPNAWDLSEDEDEMSQVTPEVTPEVTPQVTPEVEQTGGPTGGPIGGIIGGTIGGIIGGIIGGTIDITERQKEIIEIIAKDNKVSVTKLSNQLKINRSAAQEHIEVLKKKGLLTRIGGTRGYWRWCDWIRRMKND